MSNTPRVQSQMRYDGVMDDILKAMNLSLVLSPVEACNIAYYRQNVDSLTHGFILSS